MAIGREDAVQALKDAETAAGRSHRLHGYRDASGFLILWGLVWAFMDIGFYFVPAAGNWMSLAGDLIGVAGSIVLGMRIRRRQGGFGQTSSLGTALLIALGIGLFGLGMSVVTPMHSADQAQAAAGVAVGCAYIVLGGARGLRLVAVGLAMVALTLLGWVYAREQFMLLMALGGGGGLVLSGLWLRTA